MDTTTLLIIILVVLVLSVAAGTAGDAGSSLIFGSLGRGLIGVSLAAINHPR